MLFLFASHDLLEISFLNSFMVLSYYQAQSLKFSKGTLSYYSGYGRYYSMVAREIVIPSTSFLFSRHLTDHDATNMEYCAFYA